MTSFTSLLGSIGGPKLNQAPVQKPSTGTGQTRAIHEDRPPTTTSTNAARPVANNVAAGVKRKPDEQITAQAAKIVRTEVKVPVRAGVSDTTLAKPAAPSPCTSAPYRGTSRPLPAGNPVRPSSSSVKSVSNAPTPAQAAASGAAPKPKRGFASLMEKAKAAQEAVKAAGVSTIKHKPVEKLTKRERMKLGEDAKQKPGLKNGKAAMSSRSRSGTPADSKPGLQKKPSEPGYKGTMKKTPVQPQIAYKGTMKKSEPGAPPAKPPAKKGMGQDKYGGYASWSDLDDAEEDEEGYGSDESDDMDAGFDDMAREEEMALRAARKEDQEALQEEERHRREKLERKKKLEALSKSAAARKRF